jgi:hypothetical protein
VGEFMIQGWSDEHQRWVPQINPNGDDDFSDSDISLEPPVGGVRIVSGVLYPHNRRRASDPYGMVKLAGPVFAGTPYLERLNEERFNEIPGLGRALRFTFTLYDSKGIIKEGRTFTHIVYLDD